MLYKPPPKDNIPALVEEYLERANFVANDLDWLLALPHDKFWCQVTLRHSTCRIFWLVAVIFLFCRNCFFVYFLWVLNIKLWLGLLFHITTFLMFTYCPSVGHFKKLIFTPELIHTSLVPWGWRV